jgi:hypothetical protein
MKDSNEILSEHLSYVLRKMFHVFFYGRKVQCIILTTKWHNDTTTKQLLSPFALSQFHFSVHTGFAWQAVMLLRPLQLPHCDDDDAAPLNICMVSDFFYPQVGEETWCERMCLEMQVSSVSLSLNSSKPHTHHTQHTPSHTDRRRGVTHCPAGRRPDCPRPQGVIQTVHGT